MIDVQYHILIYHIYVDRFKKKEKEKNKVKFIEKKRKEKKG